MRNTVRLVATTQLLLILPAVLFMGSLIARNVSPLQNEPAHMAQQIVMWYAGRMWTLWVFLVAFPLGVLVTGGIAFARNWSEYARLPQAAKPMLAAIHVNRVMLIVAVLTVTAGVILTIVVLHMLAN
jgi:hypothetical protein